MQTVTHFDKYVKRERDALKKLAKRKRRKKRFKLPFLLLALCAGGCNTAIQGVNGLAKDAIIAGKAVKAATDGGLQGSLPPSGQGSMATDNLPYGVTFEEAQALAKQMGWSLQK